MISRENGFRLPLKWKFPDIGKYAFTFVSLLVILFAVYSNSFYGDWHFDDFANISSNPYIQIKDFSWENIKHCIYGLEQKQPSRPLSYLSFALNYYFDGTNVFGYHVVNFTIHYLSALFLFLFIHNTLKLPLLQDRYENIAYPVALLAAFFWAIHPVFVTSVTYIVQRMAAMAGMFYIMAMYFYLKGRQAEKSSSAVVFFLLCFVAGFASVLSKENSVMLPVSILLFDLLLIQGVSRDSIFQSLKIIIIPVIVIAVFGLIYTGGLSNAFSRYDWRDFTMGERLLTEPRVIIFYLSLLFFPINSRLTLLYDIDFSRSLFQPWTTLPAILLILAALGFAIYLAKKRPLVSFCILFYFLNHLIEGTVFNLELIYEHRNYLPAMLLFVPAAEGIINALDYFRNKKFFQMVVAAGIVVIIAAAGYGTYQRNGIISDDLLLWVDNIRKSPRLSRPHSNLGRIYFNNRLYDKARVEYDKAIALNNFGSKQALAIQEFNSGLLYFRETNNDLALKYFQRSSVVLPEYLPNTIHIAKIKMRQNNIPEARRIIENKLKKYPMNSQLLELYSLILLKDGKINEARYYAQKCLGRNPDSTFSLMIMAETCRLKNNYAGAFSYFRLLRLLAPQDPFVNLALIELYAETKNSQKLASEIRLLFNLQGSLTISEYIKELQKDSMLRVYVPNRENISGIVRNFFTMPSNDNSLLTSGEAGA